MGIYGNQISQSNILNISPEVINRFIVQEDYITENLMVNFLNAYGKFLVDFNINQNYIMSSINKTCTNIINIIKKYGINKKSIDKIYKELDCNFSRIANRVAPSIKVDTTKWQYEKEKMRSAVILFLIVLSVNTTIHIVLWVIFNQTIANNVTSVLVAPITEEFAKQVSIKGGFTAEFAAIFNAYEITSYTIKYSPFFGVEKMIIVRLKVALMHLTTTLIQWLTNNAKIVGIENKEKASVIGNIVGVLIHGCWNSLAVLGLLNIE